MLRALSYLLAGGLAAAPALADGKADSYDPAFAKTVRDTDSGVRAVLRYFPEIMIGGEEITTDENGNEQILNWDGFTGHYEAELLDGARLDDAAAQTFLREAVEAACPSADMAEIGRYDPIVNNGRFVSVHGQCPAVDAKVAR